MRESDKYYVVTDTTIQEWIKKSGGNGAISYVVVERVPAQSRLFTCSTGSGYIWKDGGWIHHL